MVEQALANPEEVGTENQEDGLWPLSYKLQLPEPPDEAESTPPDVWWSPSLYKGPDGQDVTVLYSKTKAESETYAKQFLQESIVGFDMEWPWEGERLQERVALIQVASEDKIALFHIGLHKGSTTEDLIAPSLRKLIEDPHIAKAGVSVLRADFSRLAKFFHLKPQAAFELSHLHRLVIYGGRAPNLCTTKLVKLSEICEQHLGLPLSKVSHVRNSDWSKTLNQKQRDYAAADAYVGFMLFHCMNAKRLAMDPAPPLPLLADQYKPLTKYPTNTIQLHPVKEGGENTTAAAFFASDDDEPEQVEEDAAESGNPVTKVKVQKEGRVAKPQKEREPLDLISLMLFDQLSERRRALAKAQNIAAFKVAANRVLEDLARERPVDEAGLLQIRGIGKVNQERYGAEWLEVIRLFVTTINEEQPETEKAADEPLPEPAAVPTEAPPPPTTPQRRMAERRSNGPSSSPAFQTPQSTPQLHTGLSFKMADASLDPDDEFDTDEDDWPDEASLLFTTPLSRPQSHLKRKRPESPLQERSQPLQPPQFTLPVPPSPAPPAPIPDPPPPAQSLLHAPDDAKIFRNKLEAFSKRIAATLTPRPVKPLLSAETLDLIVAMPPRTREELARIAGITIFLDACALKNVDLLEKITRFAPVRY